MKILNTLEIAQSKGQIKRWLCSLIQHESLSIGLQNSQVGGVYNPPSKKREQSAQLLIELKDQRVIRTSLSRQEIENEQIFSKLEAIAIPEEEEPTFPEKNTLPEVKVFSSEVKSYVEGKAQPMISLLKTMQEKIKEKKTLSGKASAHYTHLKTVSSDGWNLETEQTMSSFYAYADGLLGMSHMSRDIPEKEIIEYRSKEVSEAVACMNSNTVKPAAGIPIAFSASFAGDLVQKFIFSNLFAHNLALGLSCFSKEELTQQEKLFSQELSLNFDALRDFHPASFQLNKDGTVGQNLSLIEQGRLMSSIADLKGAALFHCSPTPMPKPIGLVWKTSQELKFEEVEGDFIFLNGALGLHTQDATTGAFTLAAPNATYVSNGKIKGLCKGRIQGNFFDLLNNPLSSITSDFMDGQGLFIPEGVQFVNEA